jgi:hypothetical protein
MSNEPEIMLHQMVKTATDVRSGPVASGRRSLARESDWIGRKLNQVYNQALAEPLPPEFMALIQAISERERADDTSKS